MTVIRSEWIAREQYQERLVTFREGEISIYHRMPWLDALSEGFGIPIKFAHSVTADGETIALTPFACKKKGPFRLIGTPLSGMYTEFSGPLFKEEPRPEVVGDTMASLHHLIAKQGDYLEWGAKGDQSWGHALVRYGYRCTQRPTLLIDLSKGEAAVWSSFESRARNMARKAEKAGVVAYAVQADEQWIGSYYDMLRATFTRQGKPVPHPHSFYRQMIALSKIGIARCMTAEEDGKMIAGSIFLVDGIRMLYLSGTSNERGMTLAATSLLQWHAIKDAIKLGVTEYDMGGLGVPAIDKFKRSFGGNEFVHNRWVYRSRMFEMVEPVALWAARRGWLRLGGI